MINLLLKNEYLKHVFGDLSPVLAGVAAWVIAGGLWGVIFGLLSFSLFVVRIMHAWHIMHAKRLENKKTEIEISTLQGVNAEMALTMEERLMTIVQDLETKINKK